MRFSYAKPDLKGVADLAGYMATGRAVPGKQWCPPNKKPQDTGGPVTWGGQGIKDQGVTLSTPFIKRQWPGKVQR